MDGDREERPVSLSALSSRDIEIICGVPMFSGLTDEMRRELLHGVSVHVFPDEALLFSAGDPADRFFVVLDGAVCLVALTPEGDETIIDVVGPGSSFAEAAIFGSGRYPLQAEAVASSRVVGIDAHGFLDKIREKPTLGLELLASLGRWQLQLMGELRQLKLQTPAQRLAWFLLTLTDRPSGSASIRLPYRKSLIARRIGITPESLSRALGRLAEIGVESRGNQICVEDIDRLRRYCGDAVLPADAARNPLDRRQGPLSHGAKR
jgi:CRP-like cAMP-binding protein